MQIVVPRCGRSPLEFTSPATTTLHAAKMTSGNDTAWESALSAGLQNPLAFPPVSTMFVPGDRIALAIDPELPQAAALVRELLQAFIAWGVEPQCLMVVSAESPDVPLVSTWRAEMDASVADQVEWIAHDVAQGDSHGYLATTREGCPLYLQRALCEADVVIPVQLVRPAHAITEGGAHGGWFPGFSNQAAMFRAYAPGNLKWESHQRRRREETDEAGWLLGVQFSIYVVPAPAGEIATLCCGAPEVAYRRACELHRQMWCASYSPGGYSAVLGVLDGPRVQHSWRSVAQLLHMLSPLVADHGKLLLATELSSPIGAALAQLAHGHNSWDRQNWEIEKLHSPDAQAAYELHRCSERIRVFLQSHLKNEVVEDLGLGSWSTHLELNRLLAEHEQVLVIPSALNIQIDTSSGTTEP